MQEATYLKKETKIEENVLVADGKMERWKDAIFLMRGMKMNFIIWLFCSAIIPKSFQITSSRC